MRMFSLSEEELRSDRILDCPAGACSFTALARQQGVDVTAADIAYFHAIDDLQAKGLQDIDHAMQGMQKASDNYDWKEFKSVEELRSARIQALTDCIADMRRAPERYVPAILPSLPFEDQSFDLTLSAHLLFMYADRLSLDFHHQTIQELMRVTRREIRIFPLVDLASQKHDHYADILSFIHHEGWNAEEVEVPYEFQHKANQMLKLTRMQ